MPAVGSPNVCLYCLFLSVMLFSGYTFVIYSAISAYVLHRIYFFDCESCIFCNDSGSQTIGFHLTGCLGVFVGRIFRLTLCKTLCFSILVSSLHGAVIVPISPSRSLRIRGAQRG